jgi:sec-independent protein translocase protein TatA
VFNQIGPMELLLVLGILLLVYGPKRLPGLGRQLGSGMREFKDSISGRGGRDDDYDEDDGAEDDRRDAERRRTEAALGRPEGEKDSLQGEVVSDRNR